MIEAAFTGVLKNRCSEKFRKNRWKTPVLEIFFSAAGLNLTDIYRNPPGSFLRDEIWA